MLGKLNSYISEVKEKMRLISGVPCQKGLVTTALLTEVRRKLTRMGPPPFLRVCLDRTQCRAKDKLGSFLAMLHRSQNILTHTC